MFILDEKDFVEFLLANQISFKENAYLSPKNGV